LSLIKPSMFTAALALYTRLAAVFADTDEKQIGVLQWQRLNQSHRHVHRRFWLMGLTSNFDHGIHLPSRK
jgi:hypothetical protein